MEVSQRSPLYHIRRHNFVLQNQIADGSLDYQHSFTPIAMLKLNPKQFRSPIPSLLQLYFPEIPLLTSVRLVTENGARSL